MAFERLGGRTLDYEPCRYGGSKLLFRGPGRRLDRPYAAFLGGTETYGRFIARPFPELVEAQTGLTCVNLGWPNAGVDVFLKDTSILRIARCARVTVVQLPCAQNLTNKYYRVHPRRNDRFLGPSPLLRSVFDEVDFTQFHFTGHLVRHLRQVSPKRFTPVRAALQQAWIARMRRLVGRIGEPVILWWFSLRAAGAAPDADFAGGMPALVNRLMLDGVGQPGVELVEVPISSEARAEGCTRMVFDQTEAAAARNLPGAMAHEEAATALAPVLAAQIGSA